MRTPVPIAWVHTERVRDRHSLPKTKAFTGSNSLHEIASRLGDVDVGVHGYSGLTLKDLQSACLPAWKEDPPSIGSL